MEKQRANVNDNESFTFGDVDYVRDARISKVKDKQNSTHHAYISQAPWETPIDRESKVASMTRFQTKIIRNHESKD